MGRKAAGRAARCRGERGAAMVEFALILPLIVLLTFGIIEFAIAFNTDSNINQAGRAGGRTAAILSTDPQMAYKAGAAAATSLDISPGTVQGSPTVCVAKFNPAQPTSCINNSDATVMTLVHPARRTARCGRSRTRPTAPTAPIFPAQDGWPLNDRHFGCPTASDPTGNYDKVIVLVQAKSQAARARASSACSSTTTRRRSSPRSRCSSSSPSRPATAPVISLRRLVDRQADRRRRAADEARGRPRVDGDHDRRLPRCRRVRGRRRVLAPREGTRAARGRRLCARGCGHLPRESPRLRRGRQGRGADQRLRRHGGNAGRLDRHVPALVGRRRGVHRTGRGSVPIQGLDHQARPEHLRRNLRPGRDDDSRDRDSRVPEAAVDGQPDEPIRQRPRQHPLADQREQPAADLPEHVGQHRRRRHREATG